MLLEFLVFFFFESEGSDTGNVKCELFHTMSSLLL